MSVRYPRKYIKCVLYDCCVKADVDEIGRSTPGCAVDAEQRWSSSVPCTLLFTLSSEARPLLSSTSRLFLPTFPPVWWVQLPRRKSGFFSYLVVIFIRNDKVVPPGTSLEAKQFSWSWELRVVGKHLKQPFIPSYFCPLETIDYRCDDIIVDFGCPQVNCQVPTPLYFPAVKHRFMLE